MIASITIYDDNGCPKGVYELAPSRIYKKEISTKYVFEFNYEQLNYDRYREEMQEKVYKEEN